MKRWLAGLAVVLLACVPLFLSRSASPELLTDTDTAVLLNTVAKYDAPMRWFVNDWPLENHFYRPVSTLFFEVDRKLFGGNPVGYGWTNLLLALGCVLTLFWFLRELTNRVDLTVAGASLFAIWLGTINGGNNLASVATAVGVAGLVGSFFPGRKVLFGLLCLAVAITMGFEMAGMTNDLNARVVRWLPGRTASTMTVFALAALACYARYERRTAQRDFPAPTPFDVPATKSAEPHREPTLLDRLLPVFASLLTVLALLCYEQAVMLPSTMLVVAVAFRLKGYRTRWIWQAAFWGLLVAYLVVRSRFVPSDVSGYQAQQFRSGTGVYLALASYLFASTPAILATYASLGLGAAALFATSVYAGIVSAASNVVAYALARPRWIDAATGLILSFVAFLPMAWLKHFGHYHLWPMAMRSLWVAVLGAVLLERLSIAWSRPAIQAPARLSPAPGSLPRP